MQSLDRSLLAGHRALRLAKGGRPPALQLLGFLSLLLPLGKDLGVLSRGQPVLFSPPPLESEPPPSLRQERWHGGRRGLPSQQPPASASAPPRRRTQPPCAGPGSA